jgi:hypothetical protein
MSTTLLIPLAGVSETFPITLAGVAYQFTVQFRAEPLNTWVLDIADAQNNPIIQGIALVTGADLLEQFGYLGLGFSLFVQTAQDAGAVPTFENLGSDANLYAVTNP